MKKGYLLGNVSLSMVVVSVFATSAAHATNISVNTTNTGWPTGTCSGPPAGPCCSLRQAIEAVNTQDPQGGCPAGNGSNDTIILRSLTYTASESLTISLPVVIQGNGVGSTILRGNITTASAFFFIGTPSSNDIVKFANVTIDRTSGNPFVTGIVSTNAWLHVHRSRIAGFTRAGLEGWDSSFSIEDTTIENNSSPFPGGGIQFNNPSNGVINAGIFMKRSTIANNSSSDVGGGIYYAGFGTTNIDNSTISSNTASSGGGIFAPSDSDYLQLNFTTVARNTATNTGGGIVDPRGVRLSQSIVGQNSAHTNVDIDGNVPGCRDSLIGDMLGISGIADDGGNLLGVWPDLDPTLRDLGGTYHTKVHRPFPGSPVIDVIPWSFPNNQDQRAVKRSQFGGSNASRADMGAFESSRLEAETLSVAAKSSDTHSTVSATQFSNGMGRNLQSNAANDFVTYSSGGTLPAGTYNVVIGFKKGSNAGIFQFGLSSSSGGSFTPIGSAQDGFASSNTFVTVNLGNVTFGSSSTKFFRFFVTGRNGSSSSFQVFPDFVELTRQ